MGKSTVKEGAILVCSLGTASSILKVVKHHGVSAQGASQANIGDFVGGVNIMSFCNCRRVIPTPICTPSINVKWLKGQKNRVLDGELALLEDCIVPCSYGGIVSIVRSGQR